MDRLKALATGQINAPARADPQPVLLVVDRQERVEAVEGPNVEYAQAVEAGGQGRDTVAVVARHARSYRPAARLSAKV